MLKKISKLILVGVLVLACSLLSTTPVNASTSNDNTSDLFRSFVLPVYTNSTDFKVINSNGENVTQNFINETKSYYDQEEYPLIKMYIEDNSLLVEKNVKSKNRIYSNTYYKEFYKTVTGSGKTSLGQSTKDSGEITWAISGSASCDNKYNITSYSTPSFSPTGGISGWSGVSVSSSASNEGKQIRVYYSFQARWTKTILYVYSATFTTSTISGSFTYNPLQ